MPSSQMNLLFNWSAIKGSASVKRRCPESSSISTSIRRKYMCGLAYRREVPLKLFSGIMTATRYSDILSGSLVPFLKEMYPHGLRLYQDNDLKHTSRYVQRFFVAIECGTTLQIVMHCRNSQIALAFYRLHNSIESVENIHSKSMCYGKLKIQQTSACILWILYVHQNPCQTIQVQSYRVMQLKET